MWISPRVKQIQFVTRFKDSGIVSVIEGHVVIDDVRDPTALYGWCARDSIKAQKGEVGVGAFVQHRHCV